MLEAGKALLEELSIDPYLHSETRGFYLFLRIFKRVNIISPLTVYYAIDEATRFVTIVGFVLHAERK